MQYYIISLGCPKNAVDAQSISDMLQQAGHRPASEPDRADVLLVNTCGFIEPARAESLQVLRELARHKRPHQRLLAVGCWAQRVGAGLLRQVKGLDGVLGTRRWHEMLRFIEQAMRRQRPVWIDDTDALPPRSTQVSVQGHSAYLKIADGCSAPCAFCAIPLIKGPAHSRPAPDILADVRMLVGQGVREIILIAQDTTAYGQDLGQDDALPDLLAQLGQIVPDTSWIRLMYAYPTHVGERLIETMAGLPQMCHYVDLPLQHAHPDTLRRMRRPARLEQTERLIERLRQAMPDVALRTSFIAGYPGETEAEFRFLVEWMQHIEFDKVGTFIYSPEPGTAAWNLPDPVPDEVRQERYDRLMSAQQAISLKRNQLQVGRALTVLVEGSGELETEDEQDSEPISVGRSYRDAPEIDGLVLIQAELEPGQIVMVRIAEASEYDLMGEATA